MAATRIHGEFTSYAGIDYDIYIYDAEFVASASAEYPYVIGDPTTGNVWGDPTTGNVWGWDVLDTIENPTDIQTHKVALPGFTIEYETQNENLYTPLMPSKLTFKLMFENETQETFLNSLASSYEGQHLVRVLKEGELYWAGVLIPDVIKFEDQAYPYEFSFTAIDGLSRLKSTEYPNASLLGTTRETLFDIIYECLSNLETNAFWESADPYFVHNTDWWETRHVASYATDVLNLIRFKTGALYETNNVTNTVEFFSCYQMLEQICTVMGARLFLANGAWYFQQVTEYDNSVQNRKVYDKDKVQISWTGGHSYDLVCNQTTLARYQGQYEFLPPLKTVTVTYKHRDASATLLQGVSWDYTSDGDVVTVGDITSNGGTAKLKLSLYVEHSFRIPVSPNPPDPDVQPYADPHQFRIQIKVGLYYLNGTGDYLTGAGFMEWTTTPSYFTYDTIPSEVEQNYIEHITFITPPMVADGTCTVSFEYYQSTIWDDTVVPDGFYDTVLNLSEVSTTGIAYWVHSSPQLLILADGNDSNNYNFVQYVASNANTTNSKTVELTAYFGDGPNPTSIARIETYNGTDWDISTLWGLGIAGTRDKKLLELLANRILQAQAVPRIKYVGNLISTTTAPFQPYSRIKIGLKYYVFLGGEFNANQDEWNNLHVFHIKTDEAETTTASVSK